MRSGYESIIEQRELEHGATLWCQGINNETSALIQQARKEAGLAVNDKRLCTLWCDDTNVIEAAKIERRYLIRERVLLGLELVLLKDFSDHKSASYYHPGVPSREKTFNYKIAFL